MCTDVLAFCQARDISTTGIRISQEIDWHRKNTDQTKVNMKVDLPSDFPAKYVKAVRAAVKTCLVAKLAAGITAESFSVEVSQL